MPPSTLGPTSLITERDVSSVRFLLQQMPESEEQTTFIMLTDEEIAGVDGTQSLELVGSPYLSNEGIDQRSAVASATRSLAARGMVTLDPEARDDEGAVLEGDGDPSKRTMQLSPVLAGVFLLRRSAAGFLTATRVLEDGTTTNSLYFTPDGTALEEFVTTDGLHLFSLLRRDAIADRLATYADPFNAASEDGEEQMMNRSELTPGFVLPDTRVATTFTAMHPGGGYAAYVYATGDAVHLIDAGAFDEDGPEDSQTLPMAAVSASTLREMLSAILDEVIPPGQPQP